jgi:hypothetical protein
MEENKKQEDPYTEKSSYKEEERKPDKESDIDPAAGGAFTNTDEQKTTFIHTLPDQQLNPIFRDAEEFTNNDHRARDSSSNKDRQK